MPSIKTIRAKGLAYEREVAAYLRKTLGLEVFRSQMTQQFGQPTQGNSDLHGLPGMAPELKRVETLQLHKSFSQARTNAKPCERPLLITRRSRQKTEDSYVVMALEDWTEIYSAWLSLHGYKKHPVTLDETPKGVQQSQPCPTPDTHPTSQPSDSAT